METADARQDMYTTHPGSTSTSPGTSPFPVPRATRIEYDNTVNVLPQFAPEDTLIPLGPTASSTSDVSSTPYLGSDVYNDLGATLSPTLESLGMDSPSILNLFPATPPLSINTPDFDASTFGVRRYQIVYVHSVDEIAASQHEFFFFHASMLDIVLYCSRCSHLRGRWRRINHEWVIASPYYHYDHTPLHPSALHVSIDMPSATMDISGTGNSFFHVVRC